MGSAAGLAIASAIFSNILRAQLLGTIPASTPHVIFRSIFATPKWSLLSDADRLSVLDAYMKACKGIFYFWAGVMGFWLCLIVFVKDKGLKRKDERDKGSNEKSEDKIKRMEGLPQVNHGGVI